MRNKSKVSVVILNWNRKAFLLSCIESIQEMDYPCFEIIVVDNHSTDGSVEAVRNQFTTVTLIENDRNYGAIGGKNIGLTRALESPVDYIYMVDNDMINDRQTLSRLVDVLDLHEDVGLVAPVMYDYSQPDIIISAGRPEWGIIGLANQIDSASTCPSEADWQLSVSCDGRFHPHERAGMLEGLHTDSG